MPLFSTADPRPIRRLTGLLMAAALAAPAVAAPAVFPMPVPELSNQAVVRVAQSQQAAELAVRIQQLEEQIRLLTGQVEGLQFQLTQMQTMLEKQTADNEFRFQQLEGGAAPGKPQAATEPGGAMPTEALPPTQTAETQGGAVAIGDPATLGGEAPVLAEGDAPMHSQDPLVGTGATGPAPLGGEGEVANLGEGRPLDLSLDGGVPTNGDANAQYQAGYDAIVRGDYAFAEEQLEQFLALYPDDPQAPDAVNWLGEALIQRGAYGEAADVLLTGFQTYPDAARAPNILLKLGVALAGAGEVDTACRTFAEVAKRYPNHSEAFAQRLTEARTQAQCPA